LIDPGTIRDDINVDFFGGDRVVEVKIDRFGVGSIELF
jgi:hypothetical protein